MGNSAMMGWDAAAKVWRKLVCNAAGKLIIDPSEIFENVPTDNEHGKAPDSDWAHDHAADASAHHTRYIDAEALLAPANNLASLVAGTYTNLDVSGKGMASLITSQGDINLKGFTGGVEGQRIWCVKYDSLNVLRIYHESTAAAAADRFCTFDGLTDYISATYTGSFYITYWSGRWRVERKTVT